MEAVISALYCRSIAQEFRRPVEVMYPTIADQYLAAIRRPMDLGTILVRTLRNELTIEQFRRDLHLVFHNALAFNKGTPVLEAMSAHLDKFACGLFEEILKTPYRPETLKQSSSSSSSSSLALLPVSPGFKKVFMARRRERILSICKEPLSDSEMRKLLYMLRELQNNFEPEDVNVLNNLKFVIDWLGANLLESIENAKVQQAIKEWQERTLNGSVNTEEAGPQPAPFKGQSGMPYRRQSILRLLTCFIREWGAATTPNATFPVTKEGVHEDYPAISVLASPLDIPFARLACKYNDWLENLDEVIGVFSVFVQERVQRGANFSCVWATPFKHFVWAQPVKDALRHRSPWWPGMVLASGVNRTFVPSQSLDICPMTYATVQNNISRFPADIRKQLAKLRPRVSGEKHAGEGGGGGGVPGTMTGAGSGPQLTCPEGYLIVEFFGNHDFAWIKTDTAIPFREQNDLPSSSAASSSTSSTTASASGSGSGSGSIRLCNADAIEEAKSGLQVMTDQDLHCGEAYAEDEDIDVPPLSFLEDSVEVPLRDSLLLTDGDLLPNQGEFVDGTTVVGKKRKAGKEIGGKEQSDSVSIEANLLAAEELAAQTVMQLEEEAAAAGAEEIDEDQSHPGSSKRKKPARPSLLKDMALPPPRTASLVPPATELNYDEYTVNKLFRVSRCPLPASDYNAYMNNVLLAASAKARLASKKVASAAKVEKGGGSGKKGGGAKAKGSGSCDDSGETSASTPALASSTIDAETDLQDSDHQRTLAAYALLRSRELKSSGISPVLANALMRTKGMAAWMEQVKPITIVNAADSRFLLGALRDKREKEREKKIEVSVPTRDVHAGIGSGGAVNIRSSSSTSMPLAGGWGGEGVQSLAAAMLLPALKQEQARGGGAGGAEITAADDNGEGETPARAKSKYVFKNNIISVDGKILFQTEGKKEGGGGSNGMSAHHAVDDKIVGSGAIFPLSFTPTNSIMSSISPGIMSNLSSTAVGAASDVGAGAGADLRVGGVDVGLASASVEIGRFSDHRFEVSGAFSNCCTIVARSHANSAVSPDPRLDLTAPAANATKPDAASRSILTSGVLGTAESKGADPSAGVLSPPAPAPGAVPATTAAPLPALSERAMAAAAASSNFYSMDTGCSRYVAGDGMIYTRQVDIQHPVFFLESRCREKRKAILRLELESITAALSELTRKAGERRNMNSAGGSGGPGPVLSADPSFTLFQRSQQPQQQQAVPPPQKQLLPQQLQQKLILRIPGKKNTHNKAKSEDFSGESQLQSLPQSAKGGGNPSTAGTMNKPKKVPVSNTKRAPDQGASSAVEKAISGL